MKGLRYGLFGLALILAAAPFVRGDGADWQDPDYQSYRHIQDQIINGGDNGGLPITLHHYASIAYSPTTKKCGWAYGYLSWKEAEAAARESCDAPDARTVISVCDGYCALAQGDGGAAWGYGSTPQQAEKNALAVLVMHKEPNGHIVASVPPTR